MELAESSAMTPANETHELPCGHSLSTPELLTLVSHFARPSRSGRGRCPACGMPWSVSFSTRPDSPATFERFETFVTVSGPADSSGPERIHLHQVLVRGLDIQG